MTSELETAADVVLAFFEDLRKPPWNEHVHKMARLYKALETLKEKREESSGDHSQALPGQRQGVQTQGSGNDRSDRGADSGAVHDAAGELPGREPVLDRCCQEDLSAERGDGLGEGTPESVHIAHHGIRGRSGTDFFGGRGSGLRSDTEVTAELDQLRSIQQSGGLSQYKRNILAVRIESLKWVLGIRSIYDDEER